MDNQDNNQWYKDGVKLIEENLKVKPNTDTAKNAILFLGDGMGITTITAARILDGQMKGQSGEENVLSWEEFPWLGLSKTYSLNLQGADSASSATAFLNGVKTNDGRNIDKRLNQRLTRRTFGLRLKRKKTFAVIVFSHPGVYIGTSELLGKLNRMMAGYPAMD